jgi:hypothetical protein
MDYLPLGYHPTWQFKLTLNLLECLWSLFMRTQDFLDQLLSKCVSSHFVFLKGNAISMFGWSRGRQIWINKGLRNTVQTCIYFFGRIYFFHYLNKNENICCKILVILYWKYWFSCSDYPLLILNPIFLLDKSITSLSM